MHVETMLSKIAREAADARDRAWEVVRECMLAEQDTEPTRAETDQLAAAVRDLSLTPATVERMIGAVKRFRECEAILARGGEVAQKRDAIRGQVAAKKIEAEAAAEQFDAEIKKLRAQESEIAAEQRAVSRAEVDLDILGNDWPDLFSERPSPLTAAGRTFWQTEIGRLEREAEFAHRRNERDAAMKFERDLRTARRVLARQQA